MSELTVDQRRADGSLRHLLTLDGLSRAELERLLLDVRAGRAVEFVLQGAAPLHYFVTAE